MLTLSVTCARVAAGGDQGATQGLQDCAARWFGGYEVRETAV